MKKMAKEIKKNVELQTEGTGLEMRLFKIAVRWLSEVERRDFYPKLVEFCAFVLDSEVCALFVRTEQIGDGTPRVCLVAGKLPPNHPKGFRMNPKEVGNKVEQHSYLINEKDGITGYIAATGRPKRVKGYKEISKEKPHKGKWDEYMWQGNPEKNFKCMLGVPIKINKDEIIGVIKVENKSTGEYTKEDVSLLSEIGEAISESLEELIRNKRELIPEIQEFEYRIPRSMPATFEINKPGEVVIKHSMTSICHSDIYYFKHNKDRKKLDERLPLVLGHETTGEVYQVIGEQKYPNGEIIRQKDKVVVIPLIPCKTCEICKGSKKDKNGNIIETYGENYCPSSKFMASNAPGSLRSIYKYYPGLILKISKAEFEKYAIFTEPMSNVVQMLHELGFEEGTNKIMLNMSPFARQEFTYFHVGRNSFSNIFNSITSEEPFPRTLYVLTNPTNYKIGSYKIKHSNITIKGLGLLGNSKPNSINISTTKEINNPKILILGNGIMGYLLAMLLNNVFNIPRDMIVVTGRNANKLNKFINIATRFFISEYLLPEGLYNYNGKLIEHLISAGNLGSYDIVFECVGHPAVEQNIELAMKVLKPGGIIALEGLTDNEIELNFKTILEKNFFIKGFYRSSLNSYAKSLKFIEQYEKIRNNLETLIYKDPKIPNSDGFYKITNALELADIFLKAEEKDTFGRIVINDIELPND